MTPTIRQTIRFVLLAAALGVATAPRAFGADCGPEKAVATDMTEATYQETQEAMKLLSENKHQQAVDKLTKIADKGSDYEKAVVNYNLGFAYSAMNDNASAARAFAKALSFNALPRQQKEQLEFNLGQLYVVIGQFDEGIRTLQRYVESSCSPVSAEAHIFLANALAERKRYAEALPQIDQAIAKSKQPKELWLQMKLAIAYELKEYKSCADSLIGLIAMVPAKADYWKQLSSIFYEMKQDAESVAVLALAERQGFVQKPNEIRNLYSIYMVMELPFKAGMLMQQAIEQKRMPATEENFEAVADAWINARETARAEATLKQLASMSEKGEYYFKLGAMYGDDERWKESVEMLTKALDKGVKRTGEAWMRLAVAQYGLKDTTAAIASLRKAITYDETRKQAGEWLRHLSGQAVAEQRQEGASETAG